jgi:hypothetical protein
MIPSTRDRRRLVSAFAIGGFLAFAATAIGQTPPPPPPSPSAAPGASTAPPPASKASPMVPIRPGPPPSASPGATIAPPAPNRADDDELAFRGLPTAESAANAISPYMIGDFFAGNGQIVFMSKYGAANGGKIVLGEIPSAGGSGRAKISDDNSVLPQDRVFFLFDHFDNAILIPTPTPHALNVNRYTPGFEKTFFDRNASFELRIPVLDTQNSDLFLGGDGREEATEFGNLEAVLKALAWHDDVVTFGGGIGFNLPTAPDARIFDADRTKPLFTIDNGAFHVQPFIGLLYTPSDRLFFQTFLQFDLDATGNHVEQLGVGRVGTLRDQDLLQTDMQLGYWWIRDPSARYLTGLAPTIEYHYTTTLQNAGIVAAGTNGGQFFFGNTANRLDIHNLTLGVEMLIGPRALLNIAGVVPLNGNNANRQFDSEIFIEFNRFF